jgi:hypothetical protein
MSIPNTLFGLLLLAMGPGSSVELAARSLDVVTLAFVPALKVPGRVERSDRKI